MKVGLYGNLIMEIRRLHAIGTSFGVSEQENIKLLQKELECKQPSLANMSEVIERDPGLSIAVIKLANCTVINGTSTKNMTARSASIRIGVDGIGVALRVYQATMLKRVVTNKCWRDQIDKTLDKVLLAGALSYKIALSLTDKRSDAEWALHLAVLYSLGVFAKIIAADSLQLSYTKENRNMVLNNCSLAASAVLLACNANYKLISIIESIEEDLDDGYDVGVVAAKAGWEFLNNTKDTVEFKGIKVRKNVE